MSFKPIRVILEKKQLFFVIPLLALAAFSAYGTTAANNFVLDDFELIANNDFVKDLRFTPVFFAAPFLKQYFRPLTYLSFSLDYRLWQLNPFGFHLTNVLLHFFNSILFFALLLYLFGDFGFSFVSSLFFAVHPLNSVTVNYISDRGNLLGAFFMLAGLIYFSLGYKKGKDIFYLTGCVAYLAALFARENAVLFPLYLGCVFFILGIFRPVRLKPVLFFVAVCFISLFYIFNTPLLSNIVKAPIANFYKAEYLNAFSYMLAKYITLAALPHNISFYRRIGELSFERAVLIYALLGLAGVLIFRFRKDRRVLLGAAWFLCGAIPLYKLMFTRPEIGLFMQDSWIYFSSMGLFMFLSIAVLPIRKICKKRTFYLVAAIIIILYLQITLNCNTQWQNEETYCRYWLKIMPRNYYAALKLAEHYLVNAEYKKALAFYDLVKNNIEPKKLPNYARASIFNNLGFIYAETGDINRSVKFFQAAAAMNDDALRKAFSYAGAGQVYYRYGRKTEALLRLEQAAEIFFADIEAGKATYAVAWGQEDFREFYRSGINGFFGEVQRWRDKQRNKKRALSIFFNLKTVAEIFSKEGRFQDAARCHKNMALVMGADAEQKGK
ncbi:MAG: tetratricopeptide repeat protein [Candidatus Omnitrophica bacterium]|nr:tetratricopeptide repeat protein [Candidatus Omnitrophota bacterium]